MDCLGALAAIGMRLVFLRIVNDSDRLRGILLSILLLGFLLLLNSLALRILKILGIQILFLYFVLQDLILAHKRLHLLFYLLDFPLSFKDLLVFFHFLLLLSLVVFVNF